MDQNKFINTYVDHAIGMVHENISLILQLKTQLKLSQELIVEKDQTIKNLETELQTNRSDSSELDKHRENARVWEESYNAMRQKISHMDTLVKQISDMKNMIHDKDRVITEKDSTINNLNAEIELLKNPPKVILNRKKKTDTSDLVLKEDYTEKKDDF